MELSDGVVTLRPPVDGDADEVAEAVRSSLPELAPFMPWAAEGYTTDDALAWIRREIDPGAHPFLVIDPQGEIVGSCGLNQFSELNKWANLGYWVRSAATGNGYATRTTRLLATHSLADLHLPRIEIIMSVENQASRRVAERAGAHYEGRLRSRLLLQGRHHDVHMFSFIADDLDGLLADGSC